MRVLAAPIAFNEEKKIISVFRRFEGVTGVDQAMLMDDGSTDGTPKAVEAMGYKVLSHPASRGVGAAIRTLLGYARENGFDVVVILAGNDKDRPAEIPRLLEPILKDGYDLVQGSRYLKGGDFGNMPLYRQMCTRFVHPGLFSFFARKRITDSTNGFRAIRVSVLDDPRIDLGQPWLDHYELEPYLFYKMIRLGYRVREVPVTKIYPPKALGYTKMAPITGWWSILRPLFLLGFGIKK
ncbi:MAG: glycosyltransferase family 2 protein [Candidatus Omnitrophica bacterium]|nr:glycosyltransferase family 2 protein [Candidatus Omnitrophota bacterium]